MIVSGMTMAAQHFQGQFIVVLCSPSAAAAIVRLPGLASSALSCQPKIRTLQGLKVNWQLCDLSEDVSYNEITEKFSNDEQCSGRRGMEQIWGADPFLGHISIPAPLSFRPHKTSPV